jgi:6-phosphogluconolactonase
MTQTRRGFLVSAALGTYAAARRLALGANASEWRVYAGTYTGESASRGIYTFSLDRSSGAMRGGGLAADTASPSFLALAPDGRALYAVNELTEFGGKPTGAVSAFARDPASGALTPLGQQPSRGGAPCYVTIDRAARYVLVANYVGGSVALLPIAPNRGVGEATAVIQHVGSGPNKERQAGPHAHCIILDAPNRFAIAADLGTDSLLIYRVDDRRGLLTPAEPASFTLRPGAGPRHLAFAPGYRTLYVLNELDSTLVALAYDLDRGRLTERQTLSTRPASATGDNFPADVHVHPSGHTVYASNRGDDTIAVFSIARDTGRLALTQTISTSGHWPRNFALDPSGQHLLVANQRSDSVVGFRIDADTGRLSPTGARIELPTPVCLVFAEDSRA